jgi:predicted transcriptional regulator of viral defense system
VKSESSAREYVIGLAAGGRYHFGSREVQSALGVSAAAAKLALNRLEKKSFIASPARGFYVIVPPEYNSLGCLPADQFIPALMKRLNLPYYVGLLSAAQYHGAAHQRPQECQVFVARNRRPIHCGAVRAAFIARKRLTDVPVQSFNTPRGTVLVSTPEATAIDLVGYAGHAGGLNQVAMVLSELGERLDPEKLAAAAQSAPVAWAQRLGYLLEHLGFAAKVPALKKYVREHAKQSTKLLPKAPDKRSHRNKGWKLYVNAKVAEGLPVLSHHSVNPVVRTIGIEGV